MLCKLLLMVYLKLEMCFYLFKAENKILLHNSGVCFYLLQLNVILNPPKFLVLYHLSPMSERYPVHRLSITCSE